MVDDKKVLNRPRRSGARRRRFSLAKSSILLGAIAFLISLFMRLTTATSRFIIERDTVEDIVNDGLPFIAVSWHGQFLLTPAIGLRGVQFDALVSRHTDGEVMARTLAYFNVGAHRGSGTSDNSRMHEKGGVSGFRKLAESLAVGRSAFISADHTRAARRQVSRGIVALARISGRPIVPVAVATNRSIVLSSWDKATINLPFSKGALVLGTPIWVAEGIDEAEAEALRDVIAAGINETADRAAELAHGR
ncbi:MAG: lysophospholipid acyltransferase family protein [Alphaproteobacteria bacterium]